MIITITCNPAIDKSITDNQTNIDAGGKGINVSKLLRNLDTDSLATGFIGRNNKNIILDQLDELNISHHFIEVEGDVRTNIKRIINHELYEENQRGPEIDDSSVKQLFDYLNQFHNEIVVVSGSCTRNIYYDLVKLLKRNHNYVILDCAGQNLIEGIKAKPDVIKPNKDEACSLLHCEYEENKIIEEIRKLGIDFTCVSLGSEGALFIYKDKAYRAKSLNIDYKNATGAGDSMVGAISYSKLHNLDIIDTIKFAMACASAACEVDGSKAPSKENVFSKLGKVEVDEYGCCINLD